MLLKEEIERAGIDKIEDDQEFVKTEFEFIRDYCKERNFNLFKEDIDTIFQRGLGEWLLNEVQPTIKDAIEKYNTFKKVN